LTTFSNKFIDCRIMTSINLKAYSDDPSKINALDGFYEGVKHKI